MGDIQFSRRDVGRSKRQDSRVIHYRQPQYAQKLHTKRAFPTSPLISASSVLLNADLPHDRGNKVGFTRYSDLHQPLVLDPFVRKVAKASIPEHKSTEPAEGFSLEAWFSPLKIPCPYCSALLHLRANGCSYCQRGLKNYWLWEQAICKRILLLCALILSPLLLAVLLIII